MKENKIETKSIVFNSDTVLNDSMSFVLNKFFYCNNIKGKRSMIRWISNIRINTVIINFHGIKIKKKYIYNRIHVVGIVQVSSGDLLDRIR